MSGYLLDYVRLFTIRFNVLIVSLIFIKHWNHKEGAHILENIKQSAINNLKIIWCQPVNSFFILLYSFTWKNQLKRNYSEVC